MAVVVIKTKWRPTRWFCHSESRSCGLIDPTVGMATHRVVASKVLESSLATINIISSSASLSL